MQAEIANVSKACGLSNFRYLSFPPHKFPEQLVFVPTLVELEVAATGETMAEPAIAPPHLNPVPEPRFKLISELVTAIEIQPAVRYQTDTPAMRSGIAWRASVARPTKAVAHRPARSASSLVPKR